MHVPGVLQGTKYRTQPWDKVDLAADPDHLRYGSQQDHSVEMIRTFMFRTVIKLTVNGH